MATSTVSEQAQPASLEISVSKADFLKVLSISQGVVERKSTVPILSNFLFETFQNQLLITATDLDLSLRTSCPVRTSRQGSCTIPARKLYEYVRLLRDGDISIKSLENDWVQIRSGRSNTRMVGLARKDFPNLPLYPARTAIQLPAVVLRTMIARSIFAVSAEESRYTLNGALLLVRPETITMVATDGHRMTHIEVERATPGVTSETRILLPRKALVELNSLLGLSSEEVFEFSKDDSHLFFRVGSRLLTCRQLSGTFPNYENVMPKQYAGALLLPSREFTQAVQRVSQFSDERSNAVRVKITGNQVSLSSSSVEAGESEETFDASYTGQDLKIGFNAAYLLDFLRVSDSEKVKFEFKESGTAAEFKPHEAIDGFKYRYVVMPMRT